MKKTRIIIILAVLTLVAGIVLGARSCSRAAGTPEPENQKTPEEQSIYPAEERPASGNEDEGKSTAADTPREEAAPEANPSPDADARPAAEDDKEEPKEAGASGEETPASEPDVVTVSEETADNAWTEWDSFLAMSPSEQDEYMRSFESLDAFTAWMVAAQQEWAAAHPMEEIGPGSVIDFGGK